MRRLKRSLIVGAAIGAMIAGAALAQQFNLPPNSSIQGHTQSLADPNTGTPTGANCTVAAGSTDQDGSCATTSTSGSITFTGHQPSGAVGYATAPSCVVVDASSTTVPPTYTVSTTAITLSTVINAHTLFWHCAGKIGG